MAEYITFDVQDGIPVEKTDCSPGSECRKFHDLIDSVVALLDGYDYEYKRKVLRNALFSVAANEKISEQLELRRAAFLANAANDNNNK